MSFGTGHHATTYLMIQEMAELDFNGKMVTDFGTGTAVLAILAEKLGAKEVLAIDNDDWSISNANENLEANNCTRITLQKAGEMSPAKVDIVLANINLNVIIANIKVIKGACGPASKVLLSGLMLQDEQAITGCLTENEFSVVKILKRQNWIAILAKLV
jgi:ribosomal protein L11 methyltransferase